MGIKLTVLIPVLQKNKRFSIFTHRGIKIGVTCFQNFFLYISLCKMGTFWGTPKTYRNHLYFFESHTKEHHMNHLPTTFLKIGGDLHTLRLLLMNKCNDDTALQSSI